jgi:hypothetical protein
LPESTEERITKINELRTKYESIRDKYNRDPRDEDHKQKKTDNPLSQEETVIIITN